MRCHVDKIPINFSQIMMPAVSVSVISHGHGDQLFGLMCKLEELCLEHIVHVVLTINIPEPDLVRFINAKVWNFKLTLIENQAKKGFGANHNAAFKVCHSKYFCVLNPDIDFDIDPFPQLLAIFPPSIIGCIFPIQIDMDGKIQDYARKLPSPIALFRRYFRLEGRQYKVVDPDWINGAFLLFRADVFAQLKGFDERYFMYCEDVDLCLRLQLAGFELFQSDAIVTHAAHRNTRVNFRHLMWHMVSLLRLWLSVSYRQFSRAKNIDRTL